MNCVFISITVKRSPFSIYQSSGIDLDSPVMDFDDGAILYVVWLSTAAERPGVHLYQRRT